MKQAFPSEAVDIVIKSFNRPYYLERCIKSIYRYVEGDFKIKILDDGTPPEYLEKIAALYPGVEIILSPLHKQKSHAIKDHINGKSKYNLFSIPSQFWFDQVKQCSDIFLLLEDDIWLTAPINIQAVQEIMKKDSVILIKLSWLGNRNLILGKKKRIDKDFEEVLPAVSYFSKLVLLNKFKLGSIAHRLGLMKFEFFLPFYNYYTVASAFYSRKYWIYLWDEASDKVDEQFQLKRAVQWSMSNRDRYAKSVNEITKTSFTTSATNMYENVNLDIFHFNYHLNEAWLSGRLDIMNNFPKDISIDYIKELLDKAHDEKTTSAEWQRWIDKFKWQYRKLGCEVE